MIGFLSIQVKKPADMSGSQFFSISNMMNHFKRGRRFRKNCIFLTVLNIIFIARHYNYILAKHDSKQIKNTLILGYEYIWNNPSSNPLISQCILELIDQGRSYYEENVSVNYCSFSRVIIYSGDGGVIHVESGTLFLNASFSMFYNCICNSKGGAIYFASTNSYLRMICANRCSASYYHFALLYATQNNKVELLSISYCSYSSTGFYPIRLQGGNQNYDHTNCSMNSANQCSGILLDSSISFSSSHCTFSNNFVLEYTCLYIFDISGTMSSANIVHNNSPSLGVIYVFTGSPKLNYCIISNNHNILFSGGNIEIFHSIIDHLDMISTGINNSITLTISYEIKFFNSHYCNTDIHLNDPTPLRSFEKTPVQTDKNTPAETFLRTYDPSIRETIIETLPRTYFEILCSNQMVNKKQFSVIFTFMFSFFHSIVMFEYN